MIAFSAHPDNPEYSIQLQILNLITSAKILLSYKVIFTRIQRLGPDIFWGGGIFQPTTPNILSHPCSFQGSALHLFIYTHTHTHTLFLHLFPFSFLIELMTQIFSLC